MAEGADVAAAPPRAAAHRGRARSERAEETADLPPACKAEREPLRSPEAEREPIAEIPTRLDLPSECDRRLLVTAAAKLVAEHRGAILEFLDRP